jgi:hypothetical protein
MHGTSTRMGVGPRKEISHSSWRQTHYQRAQLLPSNPNFQSELPLRDSSSPNLHASLQADEREPRCPVWPCHTVDPCDTSQKQSCPPIRPCCTTSHNLNWRRTYTFPCSDKCRPPSYMWPCYFEDPAANLDQQSYSPSCGCPVLNHRLRLCCRRGSRPLRQAPNLRHQQARLSPQGP